MRRSARAFTLIELLIVVAIVGLLISILLPALAAARDEGRKVVCLARLKEIGNVMHYYFEETNGWFPFAAENRTDLSPLHGFYYGGHPGRPGWWGFTHPRFRNAPGERPFNRYFQPDLPMALESPSDAGTPEFEERRKLLPQFQCPSDERGFYHTNTYLYDFSEPVHYLTGSSFDVNYHFIWRWATSYGPVEDREHYLQRANNFLERQRFRNPTRFVMLFEDPFDSAMFSEVERVGWHGGWNRHNFLLLDGHAANVYANPKQGDSGVGWKTFSSFWYLDPQHPDYPLRDIGAE